MKHSPVTIAVLQKNPRALQCLHDEFGFDFEKPYSSAAIAGNFTANKIKNLLPVTGAPQKIVVFIQATPEKYRNERLYLVSCSELCTRFNIDPGKFLYKYNIDHFWSVGNFEKTRKHETETAFIIAQNTEYLTTPKRKKIDPAQRYLLKDVTRAGDQHGREWFSKLYLTPRDGSRERIEYDPFKTFYPAEKRTRELTDYIDKSGYLVHPRRLDLTGRARQLRAEREKIALLATDFTEEENRIFEKLKRAKKALAHAITNAINYDDMAIITKAVHRLSLAIWHKQRYHKGEYPNIKSKTAALEHIGTEINLIFASLNNEQKEPAERK